MKLLIGLVMVLGAVFGGYVLSHGNLASLYQPFELLIILGGATGAFVISNPPKIIFGVGKGIGRLFKGNLYNKQVYLDLLSLMFALFGKARKEGLMALEADIDEPNESEIFKVYPGLMKNHHLIDFICDYLRLMVGGNMNAFELESLMELELETHHHEVEAPSHAMTAMSDGLPGFGIVAAVMGVVITMGYISEPPEVLGAHVGAALVGTFLGILLAYGFAGPMANAMAAQAEEEGKLFECAKICLMATLNGYTPQIAVEFGRKALFSDLRPGFLELEEHIKSMKK
ncbi:Flagellar motor rotation protein MotA [hydrothermal vent metagenome]|uniref:Flagellar motor rotation protein MotA n=1 Tax=hydrothermal vent metagenome TaxID=652676 RepID=A0A3B1BCE3_9ZZZZ